MDQLRDGITTARYLFEHGVLAKGTLEEVHRQYNYAELNPSETGNQNINSRIADLIIGEIKQQIQPDQTDQQSTVADRDEINRLKYEKIKEYDRGYSAAVANIKLQVQTPQLINIKELAILQAENASLRTTITQLSGEVEQLTKLTRQLTESNTALTTQQMSFQQEIEELKRIHQIELTQLEAKNKKQLEAKDSNLTQLKQELEAKDKELKAQLEAKDRELETKLEAKDKELETQLEAKDRELETKLEAKDRELETKLEAKDKELNQLNQNLTKYNSVPVSAPNTDETIQQLGKAHTEEIQRLKEIQAEKIRRLKEIQAGEIQQLSNAQTQQLAKLEEEKNVEIKQLKTIQLQQIESVQREQMVKLEEKNAEIIRLVKTHREQIEQLTKLGEEKNAEIAELRQTNKKQEIQLTKAIETEKSKEKEIAKLAEALDEARNNSRSEIVLRAQDLIDEHSEISSNHPGVVDGEPDRDPNRPSEEEEKRINYEIELKRMAQYYEDRITEKIKNHREEIMKLLMELAQLKIAVDNSGSEETDDIIRKIDQIKTQLREQKIIGRSDTNVSFIGMVQKTINDNNELSKENETLRKESTELLEKLKKQFERLQKVNQIVVDVELAQEEKILDKTSLIEQFRQLHLHKIGFQKQQSDIIELQEKIEQRVREISRQKEELEKTKAELTAANNGNDQLLEKIEQLDTSNKRIREQAELHINEEKETIAKEAAKILGEQKEENEQFKNTIDQQHQQLIGYRDMELKLGQATEKMNNEQEQHKKELEKKDSRIMELERHYEELKTKSEMKIKSAVDANIRLADHNKTLEYKQPHLPVNNYTDDDLQKALDEMDDAAPAAGGGALNVTSNTIILVILVVVIVVLLFFINCSEKVKSYINISDGCQTSRPSPTYIVNPQRYSV